MAQTKRTIKKYPNRRLYDTEISSYITLEEVRQLVLDNENFEVRDAKSGDDLTRSVLLQIISEHEDKGQPMLSPQLLSQIIRFYGHAMQGMMGTYLEKNLQTFTDVQARLAGQSKGLLDPRRRRDGRGQRHPAQSRIPRRIRPTTSAAGRTSP